MREAQNSLRASARIGNRIGRAPGPPWPDRLRCSFRRVRADRSWVRIYPVPFRRLDEIEQYKKYDWLECDLVRGRKDPRPETRHPADMKQLVPLGHMDTADNWRERRRLLLGQAKVHTRLQ